MALGSGSSTEQEEMAVSKEGGSTKDTKEMPTCEAATTTTTTTTANDQTTLSSTEPQQTTTSSETTSVTSLLYRHVYLRFFATVNVPFMSMAICWAIYACFFFVFRRNPWVKTVMIAYLLFCFLDTTPRKGGYSWWSDENTEWARSIWFLRHFGEYFPVSLIKTAELDQNKGPYILLYHPHGVIGIGACCALLCNACGFDQNFPGLRRRSVTLNICFTVPLFREWMLLLGLISANKQTLVNCLTKRGESICLLPGGAIEALYSREGTFVCYLNRRKGFVKLALETKAKLVPCLGFGENGSFASFTFSKKSWAGRIQQTLCRLFTFSMPILSSPLPRPNPIYVVVGPPVEFTSTNVDECHAQYVQALQDLYDCHKANYGHKDVPLEIH